MSITIKYIGLECYSILNDRNGTQLLLTEEELSEMGDNEYKKRHKEQGLCRNDTKPIWKNGLCKFHYGKFLGYNLIRTRKRRAKIRKEGLICIRCLQAPLDPETDLGYKECFNCRQSK
jgi:hypothetical protein